MSSEPVNFDYNNDTLTVNVENNPPNYFNTMSHTPDMDSNLLDDTTNNTLPMNPIETSSTKIITSIPKQPSIKTKQDELYNKILNNDNNNNNGFGLNENERDTPEILSMSSTNHESLSEGNEDTVIRRPSDTSSGKNDKSNSNTLSSLQLQAPYKIFFSFI